MSYQAVAEEIEHLLDRVEAEAAASTLPEAADREWIDDFIAAVHLKAVQSSA